MSAKKGTNHFKKSQDEKVRENTKKIELDLSMYFFYPPTFSI